MQTENKSLTRRFAEDFVGRNDPAVADEILAPDFVAYTPITPPVEGREAFKGFVAGFHSAFPGLRVTLEDEFLAGDRAVVRFTADATHTGDLMGLAPTGTRLSISETHVLKMRGGRIVEDHVSDNTLDLARLVAQA